MDDGQCRLFYRGQQSPGRWTGFGQDKGGQRRAEQTTFPFCKGKINKDFKIKRMTEKNDKSQNFPRQQHLAFDTCGKKQDFDGTRGSEEATPGWEELGEVPAPLCDITKDKLTEPFSHTGKCSSAKKVKDGFLSFLLSSLTD